MNKKILIYIIIVILLLVTGIFVYNRYFKKSTPSTNQNASENVNQATEDKVKQEYLGKADNLALLDDDKLVFLDPEDGVPYYLANGNKTKFFDISDAIRIFFAKNGNFIAEKSNEDQTGFTHSIKTGSTSQTYPYPLNNAIWLDDNSFVTVTNSDGKSSFWKVLANNFSKSEKLFDITGSSAFLSFIGNNQLAAVETGVGGEDLGGYNIFLLDLANKTYQDLGNKNGYNVLLAPSPDGKYIAFQADNALKIIDSAKKEKTILQNIIENESINYVWISNKEMILLKSSGGSDKIEFIKLDIESLAQEKITESSKFQSFDANSPLFFDSKNNVIYLIGLDKESNPFGIFSLKI